MADVEVRDGDEIPAECSNCGAQIRQTMIKPERRH
jgi:hypothetical protein